MGEKITCPITLEEYEKIVRIMCPITLGEYEEIVKEEKEK